MELFWTQITDAQPACPARTKAHGSAWGVSLLAYAVRAVWGIDLPETAELPGGKPYFPACPQLHFSVSHTRTAALVAVSAAPVGADVEQVRPLHPAMARRLAQADCGDLQPFELWTLRESWFKLTGAGDLRTIPFRRTDGAIIPPEAGVPDADELKDLLTLTDASDISYDKETSQIAFKKDGMQIDFGGIAKGYTSARIMDIFRACGIKSGLVNLGGNVQALGTKKDGSSWRVAVQDPQDTDQYLGVLSIQDKAVITSGGYERYFEQDGRTYHHIIDPKTGYPVENGLISVSIVTADGTLADGLSTSVFIMGKEAATEYWRNHSDEFDMILMTDDREIYVTEGIADSFESEMDTKIIEKKV